MGTTGLPREMLLQLRSTINLLFYVFLFPLLVVVVLTQRRKSLAAEEALNRQRLLEATRREDDEEEGVGSGYGSFYAQKAVEERVCAVCGCASTSRCSRCKSVRYCSGNCQIIHWRQGHKYECQPLVQNDMPEKEFRAEATHSVKSQISKENPDDFVPKFREMHLEECAPGISSSSLGVFAKEDGPDRDICAGPTIVASCPDFPGTTSNGFANSKDSAANCTATTSNHPEAVLGNPSHSNAALNCRSSSNDSCRNKAIEEDLFGCRMPSGNSFSDSACHSSLSSKSIKDALLTGESLQRSRRSKTSGLPSGLDHENRDRSYRGSHNTSFASPHPVNGFTVSCTQPRNNSTSASSRGYGLKTSIQKVVWHLRPSKSPKTCKVLFPYDLFIKLYNEKVELHTRGLANMGNSCYANAVLQCLVFTHPLTAYFLQGFHRKSCLRKQWCFTCELENLVVKMKQDKYPLSPAGILSRAHFIGRQLGHGKEEDAHEFLRYAVDAMQYVCLEEAYTKAIGPLAEETTLLHHVFGGYLQSKVTCIRCHTKSECRDRTMDLTVEIHGDVWTLAEALRRFTSTEVLDGDNKYFCNRCKSYEKATKQLKIVEAPNILTIVMKRFQAGKSGKINKMVDFPQVLNLAPYMCNPSDKAPGYNLYAVIEHLGSMNAASSGHYVSYVKNPQGKWYEADDSLVKGINLEKVLSSQAYILFYARCSPRAQSLSTTLMPKFSSETKGRSCQGSLASGRIRDDSDISLTFNQYQSISSPDCSDSSSDTSSLLSCSDEGSSSTESTRDSISVDDYDHTLGDYDSSGCYSPFRFSGNTDNSTSCPQAYGHPPVALLSRHTPTFVSSMDPSSSPGFTGMEEADVLRRLGYDDAVPVASQWHHESSLFDTTTSLYKAYEMS